MKLYGIIETTLGLILAVTAGISRDNNVSNVNIALRQHSADFLKNIYAATGQQQPEGSLEVIVELIAASVPETIRQRVAYELETEGDGILSDALKEQIHYHILEWLLQYIPVDLQQDITAVLETYRTTGQISEDCELVERVRKYITSLETGRNKRGFWGGILQVVLEYVVHFLSSLWDTKEEHRHENQTSY
uniref:Putative 18.6 kDa secreted protein n=1 Tax=Aedes albopictus TaxID=7160 RepID=A0A023EIT1_AEDAL